MTKEERKTNINLIVDLAYQLHLSPSDMGTACRAYRDRCQTEAPRRPIANVCAEVVAKAKERQQKLSDEYSRLSALCDSRLDTSYSRKLTHPGYNRPSPFIFYADDVFQFVDFYRKYPKDKIDAVIETINNADQKMQSRIEKFILDKKILSDLFVDDNQCSRSTNT